MRLYLLPLSCLVGAAATMVVPPLAGACEPGYCITQTFPKTGDTGVPPQAQIAIFYNTTPGTRVEVELVATDDPDVEIEVDIEDVSAGTDLDEVHNRVVFLTPQSELSPDTDYQLHFAGDDVCSTAAVAFSTGTAGPVSAPSKPIGIDVSASCETSAEEQNDCVDGSVYPRASILIGGSPVPGAIAYSAYVGEERVASAADLPLRLLAPLDSEGSLCLKLVAIATDGAESVAGDERCVDLSALVCEEEEPGTGLDAGTGLGEGDSDAGEDPGGEDRQAGDGCSASGQAGCLSTLFAAFLAVAMARRRRTAR